MAQKLFNLRKNNENEGEGSFIIKDLSDIERIGHEDLIIKQFIIAEYDDYEKDGEP